MRSTTRSIILVSGILVAFLLAGCAASKPTSQPQCATAWRWHDTVDAAFVAQYARVPVAENVMIIDARPKRAKFDKGHIPMAVSIPHSQFDKMTDLLPDDKNALLIFYCGGLRCKLSHKSARKAAALGYANVKVFAAGYLAWMKVKGNYAAVSVDYVKQQIDSRADMALVDTRPKRKKFDKGHIPTAISIPDSQFEKYQDRLPADKRKLLIFYCGGLKCKLSHKSAAKAIALGYTNVKVFAAGYPAWKKVVAQATPVQVKTGREEGSIDVDTFKAIMAEKPESIYLIDVRDADEFSTGSLKTAVNIPVDDLEKKIRALPTDIPVVFICGTGARSGESFYRVQDLRPRMKNVFYLDAEMIVHEDGSFELKQPI